MTAVAEMIRDDALQAKAIEIAKNALKKGFSVNDIIEITGLDESTIKRLQVELNNE